MHDLNEQFYKFYYEKECPTVQIQLHSTLLVSSFRSGSISPNYKLLLLLLWFLNFPVFLYFAILTGSQRCLFWTAEIVQVDPEAQLFQYERDLSQRYVDHQSSTKGPMLTWGSLTIWISRTSVSSEATSRNPQKPYYFPSPDVSKYGTTMENGWK